jgi:hypothetical protein
MAVVGGVATVTASVLGENSKWGVVATSVVAILTAFGVYQVSNEDEEQA